MDANTYGPGTPDNMVTFYEAVVDPASANIAAYTSIVASTNYYLMSQAAENGGVVEKGSFHEYIAGLNSIMLGGF